MILHNLSQDALKRMFWDCSSQSVHCVDLFMEKSTLAIRELRLEEQKYLLPTTPHRDLVEYLYERGFTPATVALKLGLSPEELWETRDALATRMQKVPGLWVTVAEKPVTGETLAYKAGLSVDVLSRAFCLFDDAHENAEYFTVDKVLQRVCGDNVSGATELGVRLITGLTEQGYVWDRPMLGLSVVTDIAVRLALEFTETSVIFDLPAVQRAYKVLLERSCPKLQETLDELRNFLSSAGVLKRHVGVHAD
jgi:hypothetical protein